ncbi:molybdopterin-dependent oxidoreductase [Hymenobacter busanensis]|uniref:Molybdopterin-dependent oxidoreductase n=1 Tax=Hymenobacter busanensis TaxID=2607656 RepID=A0A7L4ZVY0_9BACT|nr:molybdopterin-dependent oxidoreductase [Hymenobacter busanensis]KAA9339232.1 molybdopterin-dependent oxidoreductase [Hymenobacter busanensis]QHJ07006.1 molybdopterin-dependent oxidoreductase [Hymenobacter busanensis]
MPASSSPDSLPREPTSQAPAPDALQQEIRRRSRRSFLLAGGAALLGLGGWGWLVTRPDEDGVPAPLRRVLDANGRLSAAYFRNTRLAPEFARGRARAPRVNGKYGLKTELDAAAWRLNVQGFGPAGTRQLTLADIRALPKVEMITELKCIEGWSTVVHWGGARFADFLATYPLATRSGQPADPNNPPADLAPFVSLVTPDRQYYVGLDMQSALHPQTLLCYEMNGQPLTPEHGAPLRLVTPLKYGIKHLKRIGTIAFVDQRPADFWAERGYDWDSGH